MNKISSIETAVLGMLFDEAMHGYEIEKAIEWQSMREWTDIAFSSIYYVLKRLEKKHGQEPGLLVLKGLYINNKKESTQMYKKALAADPNRLRAHCLIAEWLLKYHDPDGALKELQQVLDKDL